VYPARRFLIISLCLHLIFLTFGGFAVGDLTRNGFLRGVDTAKSVMETVPAEWFFDGADAMRKTTQTRNKCPWRPKRKAPSSLKGSSPEAFASQSEELRLRGRGR
jgi:hypothetical protein